MYQKSGDNHKDYESVHMIEIIVDSAIKSAH